MSTPRPWKSPTRTRATSHRSRSWSNPCLPASLQLHLAWVLATAGGFLWTESRHRWLPANYTTAAKWDLPHHSSSCSFQFLATVLSALGCSYENSFLCMVFTCAFLATHVSGASATRKPWGWGHWKRLLAQHCPRMLGDPDPKVGLLYRWVGLGVLEHQRCVPLQLSSCSWNRTLRRSKGSSSSLLCFFILLFCKSHNLYPMSKWLCIVPAWLCRGCGTLHCQLHGLCVGLSCEVGLVTMTIFHLPHRGVVLTGADCALLLLPPLLLPPGISLTGRMKTTLDLPVSVYHCPRTLENIDLISDPMFHKRCTVYFRSTLLSHYLLVSLKSYMCLKSPCFIQPEDVHCWS